MESAEQARLNLCGARNRGEPIHWRRLFQCCDRSGTGVIELTEFRSLVRNYARVTDDMVSDSMLLHLFSLFPDLDDGSAMIYSEFLVWMDCENETGPQANAPAEIGRSSFLSLQPSPNGSSVSGDLQAEPLRVNRRRQLEEAYLKRIKVNLIAASARTGSIHWQKLFYERTSSGVINQRYGESFSGKIEFQEFRTVVMHDAGLIPGLITGKMLEYLFKRLDADNSGTISCEQFLAWMKGQEIKEKPSIEEAPVGDVARKLFVAPSPIPPARSSSLLIEEAFVASPSSLRPVEDVTRKLIVAAPSPMRSARRTPTGSAAEERPPSPTAKVLRYFPDESTAEAACSEVKPAKPRVRDRRSQLKAKVSQTRLAAVPDDSSLVNSTDYVNLLMWLCYRELNVLNQFIEPGEALKPPRAEAAARVRAALGAVVDFAKGLEQQTLQAKQRAAEAVRRTEAATKRAKEAAQAICRGAGVERLSAERLECMEKVAANTATATKQYMPWSKSVTRDVDGVLISCSAVVAQDADDFPIF